MPPDMTAIREALMRRRAGGVAGGDTMPAIAQRGLPVAPQSPVNAPTTPLSTAPVPQNAGGVPMPQGQQQGQPQSAPKMPKPQPQYDEQTKVTTKALINQLMKVL